MSRVMTIAKREVTSLFFSPIAYIVMFLFLLYMGLVFAGLVFVPGQLTELRRLVDFSRFGLFFIVPLMTMSLFSDEYRSGRIEMLRTSPITEFDLLLGKFIGAMFFFLILLGLTLIHLTLLMIFGHPDYGQTFSCYLGLALMGMMFVSVGLFYSSCTQNQIVAALGSLLTLGFFTFSGGLSELIPGSTKIFEWIHSAMIYLSVGTHLEDFSKGVLDTSHLSYFLGFSAIFLFMTYLVLESRKWR